MQILRRRLPGQGAGGQGLKARIGVKPADVIVYAEGNLDTRSEHKAKRLIDERKK